MGQLQKVSWRTAGYAALGTVVAAASVVAIVNSDGVRPTSLISSAATRWLVDQVNGRVVLVDGLAGRVVAKIESASDDPNEVAVQGAGGAFLLGKTQGSVRTISTAKLQLGTAQPLSLLLDTDVKFGVGASGLTIVSAASSQARVVAVDDVTRPITVPTAKRAYVAADGSMWLLDNTEATHINVDASTTSSPLRSITNQVATIGSRAVSYDGTNRTVRWLDGGDVPLFSVPNASQAVLQQPGDAAPCAWLGVGDELDCVGPTGIDHTVVINGMDITQTDRLAVAGSAAVIVSATNEVQRIDLERRQIAPDPATTVRPDAPPLTITAAGDLIWLDDQSGNDAWIVHRFGINHVKKDDADAPLLDAQGQLKPGAGVVPGAGVGGNPAGDDAASHLDHNGKQDPPHAVDDSVTARAGTTITIPVTGNDWDPDGDAIAVDSVGETKRATHGTTDVLNGTSVAYKPDPGFSGTDTFEYTIVDEHGGTDSATVSVELFPPGSPNQPPVARPDHADTRPGRPVTIDVLANDIDPERDILTVSSFRQNGNIDATITNTVGPTRSPALKYDPPATPGIYTFTYQAADPQGGTSQKTLVTVNVSGADARNVAPVTQPDAIRLPVGKLGMLDVKANDTDADGDDLTISADTTQPRGVEVEVIGQQLAITLQPGASDSSLVHYTLSDTANHHVPGKVLVLRIGDTAPNRPPVANADSERVVIGNSVKIAVTANDVDPDQDDIRLLTATRPADGAGITAVEGNFVRFTPNLPDITEPTPVTFAYTISDGHGNEAVGNVTVTVLVEALPGAPFARDDFADTVTDKPVNIDVLANDSDPSGGRPDLIGQPTCTGGGSATSTPDNRVTFVPPAGLTGTFRCKYTVINSQLLKAEATIIVTVTDPPPGNHAPELTAPEPLLEVNVGGQIAISAAQFAHDADNDPLVFSTVGKPNVGLTDFPTTKDSFIYTAPVVGSADKTPVADNVDVTISDGHDGNVRTSISIKIIDNPPPAPTPAAPVASDFTRSVFVGDPVLVDVVSLLHDSNPNTTLTLTNASVDSGPGAAQVVNGLVSVTTTGTGVVVVSYTVTNSDAISASGKITVNVTEQAQNTPPVAVDDTLTISSGGSNSVDLLANDSGINDPGDKASIILVNRPPTDFGSVDVSGGVLTFVAAPGAAGLAVIKYTLSDGSGQSSTASVTLNVEICSVNPPSAPDASTFTPYMTPINIDLQTQYVKSGSIVAGSVSGAGLTGPIGVYTPPAGMNGTEIVTYTVENGCHQTANAQLSIDVNKAPVAGTVTENMSHGDVVVVTADELASDDEPVTITALGGVVPAWATLQPGSTSGGIGARDEPTIRLAPPNNVSGDFTFTATVTDPGGLTAVATITVSVANLAPTAVADAYTTAFTQFTFDPTENDVDPEGAPLCVQTISVTDSPSPGSTIVPPSPAPTCLTAVTVALTHGVTSLSYTVRDDGGQISNSSTITITSNQAPILPNVTATTDQPTIDVELFPSDPDGDPLTIACQSTPDFDVNVTFEADPGPPAGGGRFVAHVTVLNPNRPFTASFPCTVNDGFVVTNSTVTLTITP
jgi:hypothetical protein